MVALEVISAVFTEKNQKLSGKQLYFQHKAYPSLLLDMPLAEHLNIRH